MNKKDLDLAFIEYDITLSNIKQIGAFNQLGLSGFDMQLRIYESVVKDTDRKEGHKQNVMFQTDFIEETYKDFLQNQRSIPKTIKKLKKWHKDLLDNNKDYVDWDFVIFSSEPNNLQDIIDLHSDKMSDEVYWKTIAHCYTMSNLSHSESAVITYYLNTDRPNKYFLMDEEERKYLDELPEEITIYRGCSRKEIETNELRFSWTLDKKTAEFFAFEYRLNKPLNFEKSDYIIIERTISKSEVVAYFGGRNESEILYFPNK